MLNKNIKLYLVILISGLLITNLLFVVSQHQQALVFQFGEVVRVIKSPGLKLKVPFIQKIIYFDNRILNITADDKEITAKDQKRIRVNTFAKYKIVEPLKFYKTVRDEAGVRTRLNTIIESSLRQVLGEEPLSALLTSERALIMRKIQQLANTQATDFGVDVIDVRIVRADLPKENSEAIFKRMQTDREKEAKEIRAEGAEEALRIKSRADKEAKILLAEAQKKAQIIRGEGDGISSKIFADAFNRDPEFYNFYRSMQAYQHALNKNDTTFVLSPDSKFFKYFDQYNND
jgi:membrane protease subunit HflC